jgi:hypothetical protein
MLIDNPVRVDLTADSPALVFRSGLVLICRQVYRDLMTGSAQEDRTLRRLSLLVQSAPVANPQAEQER